MITVTENTKKAPGKFITNFRDLPHQGCHRATVTVHAGASYDGFLMYHNAIILFTPNGKEKIRVWDLDYAEDLAFTLYEEVDLTIAIS